MLYRIATVIFLATTLSFTANAQFNRLINRTVDKLGDEVERMAVEKISDVIAKEAAERIEREFDKLIYESMGPDTVNYNRDSAAYKLGQSYAQFLAGMNEAVDLPEQYNFDLDILYSVESGDEKEAIRYFFSKSAPVVGIQTATSENVWSLIVMDTERDAIIMYSIDGEKKTAQAVPNVMKMMSGMATSDVAEQLDFTVEKTGKKQKIAGFRCQGYKGESSSASFEAWTTDALGVSWKEAFGPMLERFTAGGSYQENWSELEGLALKSETFDKEDGKLLSAMEAREVNEEAYAIDNSEFAFSQNE